MTRKPVIINKSNYFYTDEMYGAFYICPKCKCTHVFEIHRFCPDCGRKIEWNLEDKLDDKT